MNFLYKVVVYGVYCTVYTIKLLCYTIVHLKRCSDAYKLTFIVK